MTFQKCQTEQLTSGSKSCRVPSPEGDVTRGPRSTRRRSSIQQNVSGNTDTHTPKKILKTNRARNSYLAQTPRPKFHARITIGTTSPNDVIPSLKPVSQSAQRRKIMLLKVSSPYHNRHNVAKPIMLLPRQPDGLSRTQQRTDSLEY